MDAVTAGPDLRWDHIIVDEGQDFQTSWWIALESALVPDGTLRVFSDSNQRVYPDRKVHKELRLVPILLGRNLRNTKAIHNAASIHYDGPDIIAEGPDGKEVKWIEADTAKAMIDAARSASLSIRMKFLQPILRVLFLRRTGLKTSE
jgi:hypothetical protein